MFDKFKKWLKYRVWKKNHILKLRIPAEHVEDNERLLAACFAVLEHHVEEVLSEYYDFGHKWPRGDEKRGTKSERGQQFLSIQIKKLDRLRKDSSERRLTLSLEQQSEVRHFLNCEVILSLYTWWKFKRPERGDVFVHSGFTAYYTELLEKYGEARVAEIVNNGTSFEASQLEQLSVNALYIQDQWIEEDKHMLDELIKLKDYLQDPK